MDDISLKYCSRCPEGNQWHPATTEFFHRDKRRKDGLHVYCKACMKAYHKEYYQQPGTQERIQAYQILPEVQVRMRANSRAYRKRHPEHIRSIFRRYRRSPAYYEWQHAYRNRPEVQERRRAYELTYRHAHIEKVREQERLASKTYHIRHREQCREQQRAYKKVYRKRPEEKERRRLYRNSPRGRLKARIYLHNYHARKRAIPGEHTAEQIQELLKRQKYRCYYAACGHAKFPRVKENGKWKYLYHIEHTFPVSRVAGTDIPANDISYLVLSCQTCNMSKNNKFPWEWPEGGKLL